MRILLDQQEIQTALEAFVATMGIQGSSGVELSIVGEEIQAKIVVSKDGLARIAPVRAVVGETETSDTTEQPAKRRGGRVLGSKNKPKGDAHVAAASEAGDDLFGSGTPESGESQDEDTDTETTGDEPEGKAVDLFGEGSESGDEEADGTGSEEPTTRSSTNRGNLFGDSDTESSETDHPESQEDSGEDEVTTAPKARRPSIFDAE